MLSICAVGAASLADVVVSNQPPTAWALAGLIVALTGLITAITAYVKARTAHEEVKQVKQNGNDH